MPQLPQAWSGKPALGKGEDSKVYSMLSKFYRVPAYTSCWNACHRNVGTKQVVAVGGCVVHGFKRSSWMVVYSVWL